MVLPDSDRVSRVPSYSGYPPESIWFRIRDFHSLWCDFPDTSPTKFFPYAGPTTPTIQRLSVWALPRSLAATSGISVDYFSSRYLDVSVPWVRSLMPTLLSMEWMMSPSDGFPHSEILVSKPAWRLDEAYRWLAYVLHRLLLPRYSPYTLNSFKFLLFFCSVRNLVFF